MVVGKSSMKMVNWNPRQSTKTENLVTLKYLMKTANYRGKGTHKDGEELRGLLAVYARKLPQIGREDNNYFTSIVQLARLHSFF